MRIFSLILLGFLLCLSACVKPIEEIPPTTPPMVESLSFDAEKNEFTGKANALGDGIKDHGFVWSLSIAEPILANSEKKSLGVLANTGTFVVEVDKFAEGIEINARAYLIDKYDREFYGNVLNLTTSEETIGLNTDVFQANVDPLSGRIKGEISTSSDFLVAEHGHCWSLGLPTIDSARTELGRPTSFNLPYIFESELVRGDYKAGKTYQIRAYAIDERDSVFYGNVQSFKVSDFWDEMTTPAGFWSTGPALVIHDDTENEDLVFIRDTCETNRIFWQYNFTTKVWGEFGNRAQQVDPFRTALREPIGFVIDNSLYIGAGLKCPDAVSSTSGEPQFLTRYDDEFWKNETSALHQENSFSTNFYPPDSPSPNGIDLLAFTGGVSFVLGGKAYFGTGKMHGGHPNESRPEIFEFDPQAGAGNEWRTIKSGNEFYDREGASAFSVGNKGYIGLGRRNGLSGFEINYSSEFDVYNEMGTIIGTLEFPGGKRFNTVAFTVNGKGYVGLGQTWEEDQFGNRFPVGWEEDLWSFDPEKMMSPWTQVADFPVMAPEFPDIRPYSFVHEGIAYVGYGNKIWRYYPDLE